MSTGRLSPSKSALQLLAAGDGRGHRVVLGGIGAMPGARNRWRDVVSEESSR